MTGVLMMIIFTVDRFPSVAKFYNRASEMLVWPYSPEVNVVIRVFMMRAKGNI